MNHLFNQIFTWPDLFMATLVLVVAYILLRLLNRLLRKALLPEQMLQPMRRVVKWILLFFEPTAALLLLVIFAFIRPILHAPVVALLLIGGFAHLRNYLSGFVVKLYDSVAAGNRIRTASVEGTVIYVGRLGLWLRTADGQHFSNFSKLLSEGYTIVTGKDAGGFFQLHISKKENEEALSKIPLSNQLYDLLAQAPYISPKYKVDIFPHLKKANHFNAKIWVEEEPHLYDLISLLNEREWEVEVFN